MNSNLRTFLIAMLVVWVVGIFAYLYFLPNIYYSSIEQTVLKNGFSPTGVPINTLYTAPGLGSPSSNTLLLSTGANRDTLYTGALLDLSGGPEVLHVPDMSGRYYSIEFVDSRGNDFADLGSGTPYMAGNYLISGPGWKGQVPPNMTQIASPDNRLLLIARVMVENESSVPMVYNLSRQIKLTPLGG